MNLLRLLTRAWRHRTPARPVVRDVAAELNRTLPDVHPRPLYPDLDTPPFFAKHSVRIVNGVRVLGRKPAEDGLGLTGTHRTPNAKDRA